MKTSLILLAAIVALLNFGCAGKPRGAAPARATRSTGSANEAVLRLHFAGTGKLFAQPGTAKLKQVWELPGTLGLRNEALDRFARVPAHLLASDLVKDSPDQAALFRSLLEDILTRESYFELRAAPEFALAIRLPEERARLWQTNLANAITNWKLGTPASLNSSAGQGWEAKTRGTLKAIRFIRAGEWAVLAAGTEPLAPYSNVLAAARAARPPAGWLEGIADLQQLQRWVSWLPNFDNLPTAHFSLSNRTDVVRTAVQLDFARPHGWKPEPWRIPTNVLHDPLVSFTAAQGIAPLLNSMKVVRDIGWQPAINQLFFFANERIPFQLNAVFPTTDVTNQLKRATPKIESALKSAHTNLLGRIVWDDTRRDVIWHGLPIAIPRLSTFRDPDTEFLFLAVFQPPPPDTPAPAELLAEFSGKKDVAYYDWELTEPRIDHWRQLYQLAEIATRHALTPTNVPSELFFIQASPLLGNTGTKITVTSPTAMSLLRNSDLGLTAFELVTLTRWIESTNFPAFGIFGPQPPPIRRATK